MRIRWPLTEYRSNNFAVRKRQKEWILARFICSCIQQKLTRFLEKSSCLKASHVIFLTRKLVYVYGLQNACLYYAFTKEIAQFGASVAKWLAHLPFTFKVARSSLSENFLNATRTQSSCEKSESTLCRKSWVFSGYSGFLPQGKLTGWVRQKGPTVIGICCCGDPALVGKAK
jgi:hypothetical protein